MSPLAAAPAERHLTATESSLADLRVLIVDDSSSDRYQIRTALARAGTALYEVFECSSGEEAQPLAQRLRPDAVILDYRLPGEDGISWLEQLSRDLDETAFLIMTGQGDEGTAVRAMKAGAADYLVKDSVLREPVRIDRAVRAAIHTKRLERENLRLMEALRERNLELERLNKKLWELSHTDELTGYFNRRYVSARLDEEIARTARYDTPLSVVLFDLDHFKQVNDEYGHLAGDQVLRTVATFVRTCLRDTDLVGRFGGEEFLLILTNTDLHGAELFCNRIRERVQRLPILVGEHVLHITASFGVASFGPHCESANALLRAADINLYAAKAQGRNRVVARSSVPVE